jgi:hypothetical protein
MDSTTDTPSGAVVDGLARLDAQEREISAQRRDLHEQIDRIYLSAPLSDDEVERLDELEELERHVSEQRRRVHREIDLQRATIGLPPWRPKHELDDAA